MSSPSPRVERIEDALTIPTGSRALPLCYLAMILIGGAVS
jgi:hypothetical protein